MQKREKNIAATAPEIPVLKGYTFTSWDQSFDNVLSDLEVMAIYEINHYTVTFLSPDGSVISTVSNVEYGATVTPPETEEIYFDWKTTKGYRFTGWKNWDQAQPIVDNISITADYSEEITEPIIAIETQKISGGAATSSVRAYLCGSFEYVYGISLKIKYAEQLGLTATSAVVNSKLSGSEATLDTDNCLYELSWAGDKGKGITVNKRQELLTLTFNIAGYTDAGEYAIEILDGTYIIEGNLQGDIPVIQKSIPVTVVGRVIISE